MRMLVEIIVELFIWNIVLLFFGLRVIVWFIVKLLIIEEMRGNFFIWEMVVVVVMGFFY